MEQSPTQERRTSFVVLLLGAGTLIALHVTNLLPWLLEGSILSLLLGLAGLGGVILLLALRVVHYADALAIRLGEPFGTLIGMLTGTKVILGLDPFEMALLGLTLILIRPTSGKLTQLDGLMLLVVFLFWVALQLV